MFNFRRAGLSTGGKHDVTLVWARKLLGRAMGPAVKKTKAALPDVGALLRTNEPLWKEAVAGSRRGPGVLLGSYVSGHTQFTVVESVLAIALTLRGARVHPAACDKVLPGCLRPRFNNLPDPSVFERYELPRLICDGCYGKAVALFEPLGLGMERVGAWLTPAEVEEARSTAARVPASGIRAFHLDGWRIGEHAWAGALRYYGRGDLEGEPKGEVVARRYLEAAILAARSTHRMLKQVRFDVAVLNHGIYAPHGIVAEVARAAGVRVVAWNIAYRKQCFIFSHEDTYHHTLLNEPVETWDRMDWSPAQEEKILRYLESRRQGSRDWIWFNQRPDEDMQAFAAETGLDWGKPTIGLLTNVIWDAQLHYPANAFPSMLAWILGTIEYFRSRPELQLLIRIHPGEAQQGGAAGGSTSRQPVIGEIRKAFPRLPANVFVIPAESSISTYAAMMKCDSVILYGTKTGVELTSLGIPAIVAGEAWIRNKGLTLDASSADEYFRILDRLPLGARMDETSTVRSRKYAYHFFFRRMIPLPFLTPVDAWPPYTVSLTSIEDLLPGRHPGLDVICDGILDGKPFVYPAEHLGLHDA